MDWRTMNLGVMSPKEIRRLVNRDDPLILEIGANDGEDTVKILAEFPGAAIHCFECDPRPLRRFRDRIRDPRVQLWECAVGNSQGDRPWYASHGKVPGDASHFPADCAVDWDMSGSLKRPTGHLQMSPWVTFSQDGEVACVTLDGWARSACLSGPVDFIWCDTQGAEGEVIDGGQEVLARTRWLYTEIYDHDSAPDFGSPTLYEGQPNLQALMASLPGFEFVGFYGWDNALFKNTRSL